MRSDCPVCGRNTAGGNASRDRRTMMLKPHKRPGPGPGTREWCPGSRALVTPRDYLPERP